NSEDITYFSIKDGLSRTALYGNEVGMLFILTPNTAAFAFIREDGKEYNISEQDESYNPPDELIKSYAEVFEFGIDDNAKGSLFKIKSGEKIYYYEEFECEKYGVVGFLFTEKGTPIGMREDGEYYCFRFSSAVDDNDFAVPDGFDEL
ncbi:MAG: hypothetical protein NC192_01300, partial [Muribaculaceae bacterium]|nr:hypothetical protein [Muribaculaceae bacterium]